MVRCALARRTVDPDIHTGYRPEFLSPWALIHARRERLHAQQRRPGTRAAGLRFNSLLPDQVDQDAGPRRYRRLEQLRNKAQWVHQNCLYNDHFRSRQGAAQARCFLPAAINDRASRMASSTGGHGRK